MIMKAISPLVVGLVRTVDCDFLGYLHSVPEEGISGLVGAPHLHGSQARAHNLPTMDGLKLYLQVQ